MKRLRKQMLMNEQKPGFMRLYVRYWKLIDIISLKFYGKRKVAKTVSLVLEFFVQKNPIVFKEVMKIKEKEQQEILELIKELEWESDE